jgi:hypothetical protein
MTSSHLPRYADRIRAVSIHSDLQVYHAQIIHFCATESLLNAILSTAAGPRLGGLPGTRSVSVVSVGVGEFRLVGLNGQLRRTQPGAMDDSCRFGGPGQGATLQSRERRRTLGSSGAGSVCSHTSGNAP